MKSSVERYVARWSIEVTIEDVEQLFDVDQARDRVAAAVHPRPGPGEYPARSRNTTSAHSPGRVSSVRRWGRRRATLAAAPRGWPDSAPGHRAGPWSIATTGWDQGLHEVRWRMCAASPNQSLVAPAVVTHGEAR